MTNRTIAAIIFTSITAVLLSAQTPTRLTFEVVSIKQQDPQNALGLKGWNCRGFDMPNATGGPAPLVIGMGRCRILGWDFRQMVSSAYGVSTARVVGGESWMDSLPWVIEAKADDSLQATRAQLIQMLQNLLEDRFKLKFHRETRQVNGFSLVARQGGIKLEEAAKPGGARTGPGSIEGDLVPGMIANMLSGPLGGPVVDNTGIKTPYKVSFKWTPGPGESGYRADAEPGATVYSVLQDAGFRVEAMKVPQDFFVIESAEKPLQAMIQKILQGRFRLDAHFESKEIPVYNVVTANRGL